MHPPKIVIVDHGSGVSEVEMLHVAHALAYQATNHFGLPAPAGYGTGASCRVATAGAPPKPDEWLLGLFLEPDQPGALGYHDRTDAGLPLMKIFPKLDAQDGVPWSTTASHEVLETLADPELSLCAQAPDGKIWAREVCDAVENDSYSYAGVLLSNFVLPCYFEPAKSAMKLDHMGLVKTPYEIRSGGYGQWWDPSKGWVEVDNFQKAPRAARLASSVAHHHSRRARRAKLFKLGA